MADQKSIRQKLINAGLLVSLLFCYLEWGTDQAYFLFQMEYEFFSTINEKLDSVSHPLILLPFIGQLLLLFTLFQKQPSRWLSLAGLICTALLVIMIALAGIFSMNIKMILLVLPYFIFCTFFFFNFRKPKTIE